MYSRVRAIRAAGATAVKIPPPLVLPSLDPYLDDEYGEAIVVNTLEQAVERGCTLFTGEAWRPYYADGESLRKRNRIFH